MYDAFRNRYRFRCPVASDATWVAVSDFRYVRRLRGAHAPAVFRIRFDCACGAQHEGLVAHDTLDLEPLATESTLTFFNVQTGQHELIAPEMGDIASSLIRRGEWPWRFYCHPESAMRPAFPSSLRLVTPVEHDSDARHGVMVRCFHCGRHTVNLVSREHLDVPFYNDRTIQFVDRLLHDDRLTPEEHFRHHLDRGVYRIASVDDAA